MTESASEEGLLVRAEPLGLAQSVCEGLVDEVRMIDGALLLTADPAWAINTMLVMKDVRVSELRRIGDLRTDLRAFSRTALEEGQTLIAEGTSRLPRHPASSQASRG